MGNLKLFLEINALVLCGRDARQRGEAEAHLVATERVGRTLTVHLIGTGEVPAAVWATHVGEMPVQRHGDRAEAKSG